ncbi:microtubule associated protein-domain-containing protein [Lentinula edodes]|uniref:microtubule associated protein-domain-containing protein n=1 Tax=Lentinula edodes TaxID=5353 RepID=UPI001E8EE182|nr:microtubule associated protein-domain-containing protein [Lentinula edodes]KAH7874461.1 microtubule associated protein-domain-containing protein [Lentinula edodes]
MSSTSLLTALLNNLHTHLQTQTELLPTLHAQLGLPPTALEDDLKKLQSTLMEGVETQIDSRRKEVERWLENCNEAEVECLKYAKALGGNTKATGSSIGELRKVQQLPKRFEMIGEHQEKLRQLYHTKLEQLTNITHRLNAMARSLSSDFYSQDILDPTPAFEGGPDTNVHRDVTPERFSKLEKELARGKAEVTKRLNHLSEIFMQIDFLYNELGICSPSLEDLDSVPSSLYASSSQLHPPSDPFTVSISTPTPPPRHSKSYSPLLLSDDEEQQSDVAYQRIFAIFVARVEEANAEGRSVLPTSSTPLGLNSVDPTPSLLAWAAALCSSLEDTKRRREAHIQAMYDQLEGLWWRLGVAKEDMDAFVDVNRGSTEECVQAYEEELERMLELKRERMGAFIGSAREEIQNLWDELMTGEEERGAFGPFVDDEHTEELLLIHEEEVRKLKEEKRIKAPFLASIKKYFDICEEEKELAVAASDQTRLLGRGARDPGRLLREEKMRKRVSKEKPRLEQDLLASIPMWEQETGRTFLIHGESILRILQELVSAADQENKRRPPRAGSVPPRATTPVNHAGHSYMPKGTVTPAVRPAPGGANSAPNKRMKYGDDSASRSGQRAPLGAHRGGNTLASSLSQKPRDVSPAKIPGSRSSRLPSSLHSSTSLPRPIAMPMPKPGTQHHALGHGRVPTSGVFTYSGGNSGNGLFPKGIRSASSTLTGYTADTRHTSGSRAAEKKASRAHRESFRPRPSIDGTDDHRLGKWAVNGFGGVKEEEEDY